MNPRSLPISKMMNPRSPPISKIRSLSVMMRRRMMMDLKRKKFKLRREETVKMLIVSMMRNKSHRSLPNWTWTVLMKTRKTKKMRRRSENEKKKKKDAEGVADERGVQFQTTKVYLRNLVRTKMKNETRKSTRKHSLESWTTMNTWKRKPKKKSRE